MLVWASTVIRYAGASERSGRLLLVDLADSACVVREVPVPESPWRAADPNPRGGTRGVRWVATLGDRIVIATYSAVHVMEGDGRLLATVEHPLLSYTHCVLPDDHGCWVTATAADRIIRLDWSGEVVSQWSAVESAALKGVLDVLSVDVLEDYRDPVLLGRRVHGVTQLNSLSLRDRTMWVNLGMVLTAAVRGPTRDFSGMRPPGWRPAVGSVATHHVIMTLDVQQHDLLGDADLFWQQPTSSWPNHDLWPIGEDVWFNDTDAGNLTSVSRAGVKSRIRIDGDFLRGLLVCDDNRALVCTQDPLRVHEVDLLSGQITRSGDLGGLPNESVTCLVKAAG